jgi:hypothetical protein
MTAGEFASDVVRLEYLDCSPLVERVVLNALEPLGDKQFHLLRRGCRMVKTLRVNNLISAVIDRRYSMLAGEAK